MPPRWSDLAQSPDVLFYSRRWRFSTEDASHWRKVLRLPDSGAICEVGCGPGGLLSRIAETTAKPRRIVGVDRDPVFLAYARERLDELGLDDVALYEGDACSLPLEDHCLDALTSYTVLDHIADPDAFFRQCKRVLRPGGSLSAASTGRGYFVDCCLPEPPKAIAEEIQSLEQALRPWQELIWRAVGIGASGTALSELPGIVRRWGLADFRIDSWSRTIAWDDHRLGEAERKEFTQMVRGPDDVSTEATVRSALAEAGIDPPETPYITEQQTARLRELYAERNRLALSELARPGAGPFFRVTVALVASGIVT